MEDICIYSGEAVAGRIVFGHGLPGVGQALAHCTGSGKTLPVYLVYDTGVSGFVPVLETVLSGTAGVKLCGKYGMPVSEDSKTMSSVLGLAGWLLGCGADRNALVLAVGGGITTDMAGFAASIYKRGVRFAYVPTTLLAQVDAAIGGKTGVNFESYKNMLGIIRQPEFTYLCPEVLETLPERDFMSGAAELVKSFLIEEIRNDLYFQKDGKREWILINDPRKPRQSIANLFLAEEASEGYRLSVTLDMYGYKEAKDTIRLKDWLGLCEQEGCTPYFGMKSKTDSTYTGTVFMVNEACGFVHMLSVAVPIRDVGKREGLIEGRLFVYIPARGFRDKLLLNITDYKAIKDEN